MVDRINELLTRRKRLREAYRNVFSTPAGEMVLRDLCRTASVNTSTFVAGDPYQTHFKEGARRLALRIVRMTHKNPNELLKEMEQDEYIS